MVDMSYLGLTKNESKVFESLLHIGKSSASEVSKHSGVPYGRIYDVLASLEQKGLVKIIPEKGKKFVPSDPSSLKKIIEEKKKSLDGLEIEIEKLKELYESKEKDAVIIARGKKNFYKLERELPKSKKISYNIQYTSEYQPVWEREIKEYVKKKVDMKSLARVDEETENNVKRWLKTYKTIKPIPNEGVAIAIVDDSAILITLIN